MVRWLMGLFKQQPKREDVSTTAALEREERVRRRLTELTAIVDVMERRDRDEDK